MATLIVKTAGINNLILKLRMGVNRMGRSPENHLQVDHPTVSSFHCEVELKNDTMLVRDCNSTNGIYVNGRRVMEATLRPGETFVLGDLELIVESTEANVAIPPLDQALTASPVVQPGGALMCPRHPRARATYQCKQCQEVMCDACVHPLRRQGGKVFYWCLKCSGPCVRIGVVEPPKKKSLFERFKETVRVPYSRSKRDAE